MNICRVYIYLRCVSHLSTPRPAVRVVSFPSPERKQIYKVSQYPQQHCCVLQHLKLCIGARHFDSIVRINQPERSSTLIALMYLYLTQSHHSLVSTWYHVGLQLQMDTVLPVSATMYYCTREAEVLHTWLAIPLLFHAHVWARIHRVRWEHSLSIPVPHICYPIQHQYVITYSLR